MVTSADIGNDPRAAIKRDSILPPHPTDDAGHPLELLHDREYRVQAYRKRDDLVMIRGAIRDQKPPGLYFPDDPDPLVIHHMQLEIDVAFPSLEITAARVGFETHPNTECPHIADHYRELVGLSVARGFTHRVRELFGGPRGCTHTTALLQAMAPVAVQCMWSMRALQMQHDEAGEGAEAAGPADENMWRMNLNTCHVWAEDSAVVARLIDGETMEPPLFASERMVTLGLKPEDWRKRMGQ